MKGKDVDVVYGCPVLSACAAPPAPAKSEASVGLVSPPCHLQSTSSNQSTCLSSDYNRRLVCLPVVNVSPGCLDYNTRFDRELKMLLLLPLGSATAACTILTPTWMKLQAAAMPQIFSGCGTIAICHPSLQERLGIASRSGPGV